VDLVGNIALVLRQILGQVRDLAANESDDAEDHEKREQDGGNNRGYTTEMPPAQQRDQWPERETQKNCQCKRYDDFSCEIQRPDGNDTDGQSPQRRRRSINLIRFVLRIIVKHGKSLADAGGQFSRFLAVRGG
jgi:hypothetical protein